MLQVWESKLFILHGDEDRKIVLRKLKDGSLEFITVMDEDATIKCFIKDNKMELTEKKLTLSQI